MKNIHINPTDKPSNLLLCIKDYSEHKDTPAENSDTKGNFRLGLGIYANTEVYQYQNIYITNDEEIKKGDWYYLPRTNSVHKCIEDPTELNSERRLGVAKIILTTDQELIKDGVQPIDNEFLEWFVKNPNCEEVDVVKGFDDGTSYGYNFLDYKIIIPKEEPKQETLEQTAVDWLLDNLISEPYSEEDFNHNSDMWDKAKEIEKQQIIQILNDGKKMGIRAVKNKSAEQYYNENFKS